MRDILEKLEKMNESTGLAGRKSGDVFRNPNGDEIVFNDIKFFPEEGGKLEPAELDKVLQQVNAQTNNSIEWMNKRDASTGGFTVISFNSPDGERFFGRYLKQVKSNTTDNFVPNHVADFKLASKSALKMQSGLAPQDLLSKLDNLTVNEILKQLSGSLGPKSVLYSVAYRLAKGEPLPMSFAIPEGVSFSAFRDYFCEILQPIALQNGQYTGNAGEAAEKFLGGSFQNTLISFDFAKTAGLSDSTMTNSEGKFIKISSKGGKGAEASSKNLISSIDELAKSLEGKKLLDKYADIIETLHEIKSQGQAEAPLYLGVKFGIIDEDEASQIRNLKNNKSMNTDDIKSLDLSPNLVKLSKSRTPTNSESVSMYYHLISCVAWKAAEKINDTTNFSKAASDILNNGALVQVYTKAKEGKTEWTLNEFNTVYPGNSIRGIYLSAAKNYYSTGIKGNFTFKIDRGEGTPKDDVTGSKNLGREKRGPSEKEIAQKSKDIALGRSSTKKDKKLPTGNVGRAKR